MTGPKNIGMYKYFKIEEIQLIVIRIVYIIIIIYNKKTWCDVKELYHLLFSFIIIYVVHNNLLLMLLKCRNFLLLWLAFRIINRYWIYISSTTWLTSTPIIIFLPTTFLPSILFIGGYVYMFLLRFICLK